MRAYMKILKRVWAFFFAIIPIWSAGTQALCKHLNSLFLVCICIIRSLIRRNECLDHMFLHTSHEQKLLFSWVLMVAFAFTLPSSWNCVLQVSLIFLLSFSRCVHITNKCCCDKIQHCNFMLCMHNEIASNNQLVVSENLFYHSNGLFPCRGMLKMCSFTAKYLIMWLWCFFIHFPNEVELFSYRLMHCRSVMYHIPFIKVGNVE